MTRRLPARALLAAALYLGGFAAVLGALLAAAAMGSNGWLYLVALTWVGLGLLCAQLFYPHLDVTGRTVRGRGASRGRGGAGEGGQVALTFDDGPNGAITAELLDVLAQYGARATFFLVGT